MEDFEFLRNVTIGQYLPGNSLVHRLDPRSKLTIMLLLVAAITFNYTYLANIVLLLATFAVVLVSGISLKYILMGVKPALPLIIILATMQLLFYGDTFVLPNVVIKSYFQWGIINITNSSVQLVLVSVMRFLELIFLTSLLTNTTTTTELTHGLENMLRPFARLRVPAHEISLIFTIALRFVPLFAEQLEIIMKAQASRGADLGGGGKFQFIQTTRHMLALIVPLFIDAFRRSEDLILAMESRCYVGGVGRTHLLNLRFQQMDYGVMGLVLAFAAAMLVFRNTFPF
ncbi:MAG: energy-coupling factor transporter transmembrane component T family protein [Anaerolineae bacterium]